MTAKLGSFRSNLAERKERLLSQKTYSELGFDNITGNEEDLSRCFWSPYFREKIVQTWTKSQDIVWEAWRMGLSDFRKVVFAAKMGFALVLISLLIFLKEPIKDLGRHSVWAILTVVVVFEFSVGATLSKGSNRALGTLSAGGLALSMAELCQLAGDAEEVFIVLSIFIVGFIASYVKLYPTMKPYEYGFRVFLLTYCFIMVSGYKTGEFIHTAVTRFFLIALGAAVCLAINIFIYPIWAGEDLHNLVAKNFMGVASSLEGCVDGYLNCIQYARVPSKILTYQASDDPVYSGYRSAVESTSQEDSLLSFAIWEPPHGPYKGLNYPWKNYIKVSGALRHCAFMVLALHGCILSEIQAPNERRQVFRKEMRRVGTECAKVLRVIGRKVKSMEKLGENDVLFDVNEAAEELQNKVDRKSYILVHSERWEIGSRHTHDGGEAMIVDDDDENKFLESKSKSEALLDLRSVTLTPESVFRNKQQSLLGEEGEEESKAFESACALSLATFTSLLVEFVARLQNVVDSFEELSEKARFKEPIEDEEVVGGFWSRLCMF